MPARIVDKNGHSIHAVVGFLGAFLKVLKAVNPTHVFIIFDGETNTFRTDIAPEYKMKRRDFALLNKDDNPFSQLLDITKALNFIGIKFHEIIDNYETDDLLIASYVRRYKNMAEIFILSSDTDFFQLISENVKIYVYRGKKSIIFDSERIVERYGIHPMYFSDYKSLIGDSSDNLKGIPQIGAKTAARLINEFGGVNGIELNLNFVRPDFIKKSLLENIDRLKTNYKIITLSREIHLPQELEGIFYDSTQMEFKTMDILKSINLL